MSIVYNTRKPLTLLIQLSKEINANLTPEEWDRVAKHEERCKKQQEAILQKEIAENPEKYLERIKAVLRYKQKEWEKKGLSEFSLPDGARWCDIIND
jgi:hypothetical protein